MKVLLALLLLVALVSSSMAGPFYGNYGRGNWGGRGGWGGIGNWGGRGAWGGLGSWGNQWGGQWGGYGGLWGSRRPWFGGDDDGWWDWD